MKDINLVTITLLLFLWLGTVLWFFLYWRRHRTRPQNTAATDFLLSLASEKAREAKAAQAQLYKTADMLEVGLIILTDLGLTGLNAFGERTSALLMQNNDAMLRLKELREKGGPLTIELPMSVLQCDILKHDDALSHMPETIIVAQDVTRSFELAKELQYRERLAILGKMTAQIAHQLKTPLAVLAGRAQLLASGPKGMSLSDETRRELLLIYEEARALAERINDILSLYRSREMVLKPVFLSHIMEVVRERLLELEHECEIEVECSKGLVVRADMAAIEMALFLLGQNAVSPAAGAGHLTFRAKHMEDGVVVDIEDDGKGIPDDLRFRLFEPFVSGRTDGLGLGLFLAKDLVKRMGGELELVFTGPNGTCFRVVLRKMNESVN
ncbi:MAG: HAMP domain-containing sensor histidine kinase [Dissulfuribacterales bacterium]